MLTDKQLMSYLAGILCFFALCSAMENQKAVVTEVSTASEKNGLPKEQNACICGKASSAHCSRCGSAYYCSPACQGLDWPIHKVHCSRMLQETCNKESQELLSRCKKILPHDVYELLQKDPVQVIQNIMHFNEAFFGKAPRSMARVSDLSGFISQLSYRISLFEQAYPLFLLAECLVEGQSVCLLSRTHQPRYRKYFEDKVSAALVEKIKQAQGRPVCDVSFACGGFLQDLIILIATLKQMPNAHIIVDLIDYRHADFLKCLHLLIPQTVGEIPDDVELGNELQKQAALLEKSARLWSEKYKQKKDYEILQTLAEACLFTQAQMRQCKACIQKLFPKSRVQFRLHDTAAHYVNCLRTAQIACPDVVSTVDIQDAHSVKMGAEYVYIQLCIELLQKDPNIVNYYLSLNKRGGAELLSYCLERKPELQAGNFEVKAGVFIPLYMNIDKIAL